MRLYLQDVLRLKDVATRVTSFVQDCERILGFWDDERREGFLYVAKYLSVWGDPEDDVPDDEETEVIEGNNAVPQQFDHPSPTTPINKCPPEIISAIFQTLVDSYYTGWDAPAGSFSYAWTTIFWVCQLWRTIAFSTPRLFRYVDFTLLRPSAVKVWLTCSRNVGLFVWLPRTNTAALQATQAIATSPLSKVARLFIQVPFPGSPWTNYDGYARLTDLCLRNDDLTNPPMLYTPPTTLHKLRRLYISGTLPTRLWQDQMFPASLQELTIALDPAPEEETLFNEPLSSHHLRIALQSLTQLEQLSFATDSVRATGTERPLVLRHLRSLSLSLDECDFPTLLAMAPKPNGKYYDLDLRPYPYPNTPNRRTKEMIDSLLNFLQPRRGTFAYAGFDLIEDETEMIMIDDDGVCVTFRIEEEYSQHFRALMDGIDASSVTAVLLGEHMEGNWRREDDERCTGIMDALRMLPNVAEINLSGRLGVVTRDLFVALAGAGGRTLFGKTGHAFVVWPRLCMVRVDSVSTGDMQGVDGTVVGFLGMAFLAINTPRTRIREVRVQRSWLCEYDIVLWTHCVRNVIIQGQS